MQNFIEYIFVLNFEMSESVAGTDMIKTGCNALISSKSPRDIPDKYYHCSFGLSQSKLS